MALPFLAAAAAAAAAASAAGDFSETINIISSDVNDFLHSDTDEIPSTIKQVAKIVQSDEVSKGISKFSEAITVGIIKGMDRASKSEGFPEWHKKL